MKKTITLTAGTEIAAENLGGKHIDVENLGSVTIYACAKQNITAGADGVYAIAPAQRKLVLDCKGTVYLLSASAGKAEVLGTDYANANFSAPLGKGVEETSGNPLTIEGLQGGVPFNAIKISGSGETSIVGRTLTLNRCGKNLLDMTGRDRTASGVTTTIANGIVTMTGTATAGTTTTTGGIYFDVSKFPIGTVFTFSQRVISTGINTTNGKRKTPFYLEYRNASNAVATFNNSTSVILSRNEDNTIAIGKFTVTQETIDAGIVSLYPQGYTEAGYVYDNHILSVQLEFGNSATDYEPYSGTTYTIIPDANPYTVTADVRQLDGVNNLWITDESSPTISASYNAAPNPQLKMLTDKIDTLSAAVLALGSE